MIIPCGHRVLVKQDVFEEADEVYKRAKAAGLTLQLDRAVRAQESVDSGVILSVGPTAWKDFGGVAWAQPGDRVVFARMAGKSIEDPADKETHYIVINDEDCVAVIKE
jgi:co-chaperonin GroES (HSP10)